MRPIAENIFTEEAEPRLIGGREIATGKLVFPLPDGPGYEAFPLSREGRLWSWTVQRFRPKSPPYEGPEDFRPYPLGYVHLPGELIVEARLVEVAEDAIEIGMPLELTATPLDPADPEARLIPAFRPARGES